MCLKYSALLNMSPVSTALFPTRSNLPSVWKELQYVTVEHIVPSVNRKWFISPEWSLSQLGKWLTT